MKTVVLSIQILIIQIFICSFFANLRLQRKIKCNRKNRVVVTLRWSKMEEGKNVTRPDGQSVFNATLCEPSINNKYCLHKNTIWHTPRCQYQHSNNRHQVKCHIYRKFLKKFGKLHSYSTFGLKVSIFQESRNRNTPSMVCCHWMKD